MQSLSNRAALSPPLLIFLISLMALPIFRAGQQTQRNDFARADRNPARISPRVALRVRVIPIFTSPLPEFIHYRIALPVDWFNIFLLGLTLCWS